VIYYNHVKKSSHRKATEFMDFLITTSKRVDNG